MEPNRRAGLLFVQNEYIDIPILGYPYIGAPYTVGTPI